MKIFAIDTTTKFLSIGIFSNGRISEYNLEVGTKLSCLLAVTIKRILDTLGWRVGDVDYFACGLGPGSFTGIRLGLAAMKAMSWAAKKPIIGISTLDILAGNCREPGVLIAPAVDAKRHLIYYGIYKRNNGILARSGPYRLSSIDEFLEKIKNETVVFGDALDLYRQKLLLHPKRVRFLDRDCWYPKGHNIIELALERIRKGKLDDPIRIKPIYLYSKECQIKKRKTKKAKLKT